MGFMQVGLSDSVLGGLLEPRAAVLGANRGVIEHFGVAAIDFAGRVQEVIHPQPIAGGAKGTVVRTNLEAFAQGSPIRVVPVPNQLPSREVLERARSRVGAQDYNLLSRNCEHMAREAATGTASSSQVSTWLGLLGLGTALWLAARAS